MPPQRLPDSEAASADRDEMLTLLDETGVRNSVTEGKYGIDVVAPSSIE